MKHTKGPWVIERNIEDKIFISGAPTERDGALYGPIPHASASNEQDARLIASAPELLEALQILITEKDPTAEKLHNDYFFRDDTEMFRVFRALIKKATGGAE